jgi:four helix bundle protein
MFVMPKVLRFEDLEVWQEARVFARRVFEITHDLAFPKDFGYISQINNAAGSVMDNIAEGFERGGKKEFIQFLSIAKGSAGEVRSQVYRGLDRKYFSDSIYQELSTTIETISKRLSAFISSLNNSLYPGIKYKDRK